MDAEDCARIKERVAKLETHRESDKELIDEVHEKVDDMSGKAANKIISLLLLIVVGLIGVNYDLLSKDHTVVHEVKG